MLFTIINELHIFKHYKNNTYNIDNKNTKDNTINKYNTDNKDNTDNTDKVEEEFVFINYTPFSEPFWGRVVNKN